MTTAIVIALRILVVTLLAAAAYFYSAGEQDWFFACLVLAACSFFLSLRFSIKANMAKRDAEHTETTSDTDVE